MSVGHSPGLMKAVRRRSRHLDMHSYKGLRKEGGEGKAEDGDSHILSADSVPDT